MAVAMRNGHLLLPGVGRSWLPELQTMDPEKGEDSAVLEHHGQMVTTL